jgi:hypothetical protein
MAVLQDAGRIALAKFIATQPIHLAWGRGLAAWDALAEPEPNNAGALVDEVGRRRATFVGYCKPEKNGEIEMPSGDQYTSVAEPTKWVYLRFVFGFGDAAGQTLRELGIFIGTQPKTSVPEGQRYLTAQDIELPGKLYALERVAAFTRSAQTRQSFEYVMPF